MEVLLLQILQQQTLQQRQLKAQMQQLIPQQQMGDASYLIGICQLVQHPALDAATQGFKDALTEEFGDAVQFDEQNAQGDSNTCSTISTALFPIM